MKKMKMLSSRPALSLVLTMSVASFYYAQTKQDTISKENNIEQVVLTGVADIAKDRKTPVAVSTIKEAQIVEKLGNQEFPEILNNTPSVYAVKGGGGFGESKLNIRGFDQKNIAVMVNGMPVNDMETGAVYWSNWAGISDVTSAMQVQRGLGSSKLAIASVGGTVNILTRAADKKQGGIVSVGLGNDSYLKTLFAYNTGKTEKGWSTSFLLSRTAGSTYVNGSDFEAYNYYFALGYKPNNKHDFQFTMTGAPQSHNNRYSYINLSDYFTYGGSNGEPNRKYNPDWGYRTAAGYANPIEQSNRANFYHKPVFSFNWDWNISEKSKLNTVAYASFGRGGGINGNLGRVNGKSITDASFKTADGQINWDAIYAANAAQTVNGTSAAGNTLVQNASINSHNWYGLITSFNHKINDKWNFSVGVDGRYYYGYHYQVVSNLLGASGYKDVTNKNLPYNIITNTISPKASWNPFSSIDNRNDMVAFDNDGEVLWYGGFGQLEYSNDKLSAFVQGAVSNQAFQRIDHFIVDGVTLLNTTSTVPTATNPALNKKTGFKDIFGYNVKAGANYNIDEHHNVFGNIGYYSKQPFMSSVYPNNKNFLNPNLTNEKIFGIEAGYGFRSAIIDANVNIYRTSWKDRFLRRTGINFTGADGTVYSNAYANIEGVTEIHQGIEIDATAKVHKKLSINGMLSIGDWYYEGNASSTMFTETNEQITEGGAPTTTLYLDKVKVGNSAQFTAAAGVTYKPFTWFSFDGNYRAVRNLYGNVNPTNFQTEAAAEKGALKLPSFGLVDLGVTFKIKFKDSKNFINLRGNVYNLLDKVYISESNTNVHLDDSNAAAGSWNGVSMKNQVYFGFGRTWAATISYNF